MTRRNQSLAVVHRDPQPPSGALAAGTPRITFDLALAVGARVDCMLYSESNRSNIDGVHRPLADLPRAVGEHWGVYIGHDNLRWPTFTLRPADESPVLIEIGTTFSPTLWRNLVYGFATERLGPRDGIGFSSRRTMAWFLARTEQLGIDEARLPDVRHLRSGVDTSSCTRNLDHRTAFRQWLGVDESHTVFLAFSRLAPVSKLDFPSLIADFASAMADDQTSVLVIAGAVVTDPNYVGFASELQQIATELGVGDRVVLIGNPYGFWKDARSVLMSGADVFVHTSRGVEETTSLVAQEAMSFGLPCIVLDWGGLPELVRDGIDGIVVGVNINGSSALDFDSYEALDEVDARMRLESRVDRDPAQMRHALMEMTRPEIRGRMSVSSRHRVHSEYDIKNVAGDRVEFMKELSNRPAAPGPLPQSLLTERDFLEYMAGERVG